MLSVRTPHKMILHHFTSTCSRTGHLSACSFTLLLESDFDAHVCMHVGNVCNVRMYVINVCNVMQCNVMPCNAMQCNGM